MSKMHVEKFLNNFSEFLLGSRKRFKHSIHNYFKILKLDFSLAIFICWGEKKTRVCLIFRVDRDISAGRYVRCQDNSHNSSDRLHRLSPAMPHY